MDGHVRTLKGDEEMTAGAKVVIHGMLGSLDPGPIAKWVGFFEPERTHGAFTTDEDLVGLARWFATDLSIPGGAVPAAAVTAVAVLPTHRRQGHLRRLMDTQLEAVAAESVPVAILLAAEWPIYSRFGYGPATEACTWQIDTATAQLRAPVAGSVQLVDAADLRPELERVHDLRWARTPGAITRKPPVWDRLAGVEAWPGDTSDLGLRRGALWRGDSGYVLGAVAYKVEEKWEANRPRGVAEVTMLVGATPEAERELWRHVCTLDWVATVKAPVRGVDDPLPYLLTDARAAQQLDRSDCVWVRLLNLPAAFDSRRARTADRVVLEVLDAQGFAAGRWSLDLGPDGSEVTPTTASPDVRLPVEALGAAYLGGTRIGLLHEAGWLDEESPGGVERLDALLATPSAPWSPTTF